MKKLLAIFVPAVLVLFLSVNSAAQQTKIFSEAKGSGKSYTFYDFDKWNFSLGGKQYEILKNGMAKRTDKRNRVTSFRIAIEMGERLERVVYFSEYKGDLLLLGETVLGDGGAGFMVRFDGRTLKKKWQKHIPAFNLARGVLENNSAYLAGIGYVSKIDLETGKFIWKHDGFYRKYKEDGAFNIFQTPEVKRSIVVLTERKDEYNEPPNVIKFDKTSGKVIEVKVN